MCLLPLIASMAKQRLSVQEDKEKEHIPPVRVQKEVYVQKNVNVQKEASGRDSGALELGAAIAIGWAGIEGSRWLYNQLKKYTT